MRKLIFTLLIFCVSTIEAQNYFFDQYSIRDGLAQSKIYCISMDKNGFAWVGTEAGVSRFDGKSFVNYTRKNGLSEGPVTALRVDDKGKIWLGSQLGGVTYFDGKYFKEIKLDTIKVEGRIFDIYQDKDGNLWFATEFNGLIKTNSEVVDGKLKVEKVLTLKEGIDDLVLEIIADNDDNFYLVTFRGIIYYNRVDNAHKDIRIGELSNYSVSASAIDKSGKVWIGTFGGGALRYDPVSGETQYLGTIEGLSTDNIARIFVDSKGKVWISTWDGGVAMVEDPNKFPFEFKKFNKENGLHNNKIMSFYEDFENNIWLGSVDAGLAIYKGERFINYNRRNGLLDDNVNVFHYKSNNELFIGTNSGLNLFNPFTNEISLVDLKLSNPYPKITGITSDENGNVYVGTMGDGMIVLDNSNKFKESFDKYTGMYSVHITDMFYNNGVVWMSVIGGYCKFNISEKKFRTTNSLDGVVDPAINGLVLDKNQVLWLSSDGQGVIKFENEKHTFFKYESGLENLYLSSITVDSKNKIWVGSKGSGVYCFKDNSFININTGDGLISDYVTSVYCDKNDDLWIGTNKGVSRYNIEKAIVTNYDFSDGFTGVEVKDNAIKADIDGNIWIGSIKGLFKYDPSKDQNKNSAPRLLLNNFKIFLRDTLMEEGLSLHYSQNHITFDFSGITYGNSKGVTFKHRLNGLSDFWSEKTTQNFTTFSNLLPGKYTLELIAYNSNGIASEKPLTFSFTIRPPFWQTWWFITTCVITLIVSIYVFIRWRIRALEQTKIMLEKMVDERTAELNEEKLKVEEQNEIIAEKNKDITDSIIYAKRIQEAILPDPAVMNRYLPENFVIFYPRDIVSGDFYWFNKTVDDKLVILGGDCTGHGVPGAFMTMIGNTALNEIVMEKKITKADAILDELHNMVKHLLKQKEGSDTKSYDGMDVAVCVVDKKRKIVEYAGAGRPLMYMNGSELNEVKPDKMSINSTAHDEVKFTLNEVPYENDTTFYLFSDGITDQFGGEKGKKFLTKKVKDLIEEIGQKPMPEQKEIFAKAINDWKIGYEQVDDQLLIGFRV